MALLPPGFVRSGSIARLGDALAGTESTFLVDATVFPGNSGGPVVSRPESIAIDGLPRGLDRSVLVGVVAAYVPYTDHAVSQQTGNVRITFEENSGLAAVYPVDYIDETIDTDPNGPWNQDAPDESQFGTGTNTDGRARRERDARRTRAMSSNQPLRTPVTTR